ncbi:MAG: O-antigen ligase family protein [SAR324 cluster bacterium]|nr:O-antigen ligase family protein [SAR324 cluster bacterium]
MIDERNYAWSVYLKLIIFSVIYFVGSFLMGSNRGSLLVELIIAGWSEASIVLWIFNISMLIIFFMGIYLNRYKMFSTNIFWLGVSFFFVDVWLNYSFFQANTYKMVSFFIFTAIIFLKEDLFKLSYLRESKKFLIWLILFLPTLSALPGVIWGGGSTNYNFTYEFSALFICSLFGTYVYSICHDQNKINSMVHWVALTVYIICFWSFYEKYALTKYRAGSTFGNATYFGTYLMLLMPVLLSQILYFKSIGKNSSDKSLTSLGIKDLRIDFSQWLIIIALLTGLVGFYFSFTRASQLGLLVGLLFSGIIFIHRFYPDKLLKYIAVFFLATIFLIGLILILYTYAGFFPSLVRFSTLFELSGYYARLVSWVPAVKAFLDNSWIGHGLGSSYSIYFDYTWAKGLLYHDEISYNHVHNEILQIAEEGGILGLLGQFVPLLFIIFFLIKLVYKKGDYFKDQLLALMIIAGICAYYVDGIFSISQRQMGGRVPFYLILGLGLSLIDKHYDIFNKIKLLPKVFRLRLLLVGVILPIFVVSGYYLSRWAYMQNQYVSVIRASKTTFIQKIKNNLHIHNDIYALERLGVALYESERYEEAVEYFAKTLSIIPYYRMSAYRKCLAEIKLDKYEVALEDCKAQQSKIPYMIVNNTTLLYLSLVLNDEQEFLKAFKYGVGGLLMKASAMKIDKKSNDHKKNTGAERRFFRDNFLQDVELETVKQQKEYIKFSYKDKVFTMHVAESLFGDLREEFIATGYNTNWGVLRDLSVAKTLSTDLVRDKVFGNSFSSTNRGRTRFIKGERIKLVKELEKWVSKIGVVEYNNN